MLKINFKTFREKLENEQTNGHFPTIHCLQDFERFIFVFKSKEKWDYYSIVTYQDIQQFAGSQGMNLDQAIDMFIVNYCSNTTPLEARQTEEIVELEDIDTDVYKNRNNQSFSKRTPSYQKSSVVDPGEDIIEEADDYSDFLLKTFNMFEKRALAAADKIEVRKVYTKKSFGDFLRNLFNSVNTVAFANQVKRYLKIDLITGMESAEKETSTDIGFTEAYEDRLNVLQAQQVDGYTINGKKWPGIKGVTKEIQAKVIKTVQNGINENKSITEIKSAIQKDFDGFSDWRSETIARTETTNIINEGKLIGYKETGIPGKKVWDAAPFEAGRSSEICQRLNGQERDLDDDFIDPLTRKAFARPSAHPNCRSVLRFNPI